MCTLPCELHMVVHEDPHGSRVFSQILEENMAVSDILSILMGNVMLLKWLYKFL